MQRQGRFWGALLVFGAGWGIMQPANKVAVEGGFEPFGIMVWQGVITLLLAVVLIGRKGIPHRRSHWALCAQVAALGNLIPHFASFTAIVHVPAGVMSIVMSTIPIFAMLIGLILGREAADRRRVLGLALGLVAIFCIVAGQGGTPGDAAPGFAGGHVPLWALGVGLIAPICYATNSTLLAARADDTLSPVALFVGATLIFLPVAFVAAVLTGQLKGVALDLPSLAVAGTATAHTLIYTGFLWLVTKAGAVFASQTAYLVTGFGILWSMLLLGERYAPIVWLGLLLMVVGITLVRPRRGVAPAGPPRDTTNE